MFYHLLICIFTDELIALKDIDDFDAARALVITWQETLPRPCGQVDLMGILYDKPIEVRMWYTAITQLCIYYLFIAIICHNLEKCYHGQ